MNTQGNADEMVPLSQVTFRVAIGLLGMSFPIILLAGGLLYGDGIQTSISAYYHLGTSEAPYLPTMRDIFVGVLFVIGIALYFYKGYEKKAEEPLSDDLVATVAGLCAIGVALSPTESGAEPHALIHTAFATIFFLALTYFSGFIFTRTGASGQMSEGKKKRIKIYRFCAAVMAVSLILAAVVTFWFPDLKTDWNAIFWLESIAVTAFGYSWWVKANRS